MTTHEQRAELRRLSDAATKGPWAIVHYGWSISGSEDWNGAITSPVEKQPYAGAASFNAIRKIADANFIVAAREGLPMLLDEVEHLEAENKRLEAQLEARRTQAIEWARQMGDLTGQVERLKHEPARPIDDTQYVTQLEDDLARAHEETRYLREMVSKRYLEMLRRKDERDEARNLAGRFYNELKDAECGNL